MKHSRPPKKFLFAKIFVFFIVLFALSILSFQFPLRPTYSDFEKRNLTKFPNFSLTDLFSGDYFANIDLWFSDTFPFRDSFITTNSYVKKLYGVQPVQVSGEIIQGDTIPSAPERPTTSMEESPSSQDEISEGSSSSEESSSSASSAPSSSESVSSEEEPAPEKDVTGENTQSLGAVLIVGDSAYEYYNFSKSVADQYIALVSDTAQKLDGVATVYDMVIPTSMDIMLPEDFRKGLNTSSQKDAIAYINGSFSPLVQSVPIYDTMKAHADEYIYFRTDHHWTALGAYYAYQKFAQQKGFEPLALSDYEKKSFDGFLGAFYSDTNKNPALAANPDTVEAFVPPGNISLTFTDQKGNTRDWPLISDVSGWAASSKYSTFIGGDNPYTVIQNADLTDGSSCVVVKESFGNAFVPFLTSHYQTVYVIDYRYWQGNLIDFVKQNKVQDVLFANNISATRNAPLVDRMDAITS